ncbi:YlbF family regulator [Kurthia senegalensis]|uniref:YlbF family regulator n=1 Tax=Kurthia senegalensis TaxID=1033740 RepID=UPI000289F3DD|nr:YlbF family regulator [Kurthia senegalensis]
MINIYDDVNKLEATFRKTEQFKTLAATIEEVKKDESAVALFANFRDLQLKLQQKQMSGEEIGDDELQYAQKTAQLAQQNEKISKMLMAEMALSELLQEINVILTKPIQGMYDGIQ